MGKTQKKGEKPMDEKQRPAKKYKNMKKWEEKEEKEDE